MKLEKNKRNWYSLIKPDFIIKRKNFIKTFKLEFEIKDKNIKTSRELFSYLKNYYKYKQSSEINDFLEGLKQFHIDHLIKDKASNLYLSFLKEKFTFYKIMNLNETTKGLLFKKFLNFKEKFKLDLDILSVN